MLRKIMLALSLLISAPAYAADIVALSASSEDNKPVRLLHVYHYDLYPRLRLAGNNNVDFDTDANWSRIQIKPRLQIELYEHNGLSFKVTDQVEYFNVRDRVERTSNRLGAGVVWKYKSFSAEVNYYAIDSGDETTRWDSYLNYRVGKWGFNNQLWYVPETDKRYEQFTVSYKVYKNWAVQAQQQYLTGLEDVTRIGIRVRF